jgi:quinol-cytochrome oxidoreductase complex cytochrome b subunit
MSNPTTQPIIDQYLQEILTYIKESHNFVSEQAPLVVHDIILRAYIDATVGIVFFTSLSVVLYFIYKYLDKKEKESNYEECGCFIGKILVIIGFILNAMIIFCNIENMLIAYFAPKAYLIDFLSKIIQKHN